MPEEIFNAGTLTPAPNVDVADPLIVVVASPLLRENTVPDAEPSVVSPMTVNAPTLVDDACD